MCLLLVLVSTIVSANQLPFFVTIFGDEDSKVSTNTTDKSMAQIDFEERQKNIKGGLFSMNNLLERFFSIITGSKTHKVSMKLINSTTRKGTHLKINQNDIYMPSGSSKSVDGWLIKHRGNIMAPNGTIYSDVNSFYVGPDDNCSLAEHYQCIDNNLYWIYCNGTQFGMVEECDTCKSKECIAKGTFARFEKIKEYKERHSNKFVTPDENLSIAEDDSLDSEIA
jgi:hypothetical protein